MAILDRLRGMFGYDAALTKNKRQAPTGILRSEDDENRPAERRKLLSSARDIQRNFSIAAWMIRRHLDYVSTFTFQARTSDEALNSKLESLIDWWSRRRNCDVTGRFSLPKMVRMLEGRRTVDNDVFVVKLSDGRLQVVEGDRVRTPDGGLPIDIPPTSVVHGVQVDDWGQPLGIVVCSRAKTSDLSGTGGTFKFERYVPMRNAYHHGYFERFDQIRGISPITAALNSLRDTYEGFDYALAKMKVSQLFGLAFYREASDSVATTTESEDGTGYEVDFGKGPVVLNLDPGDRAEFLESKSPSIEFQQHASTMIGVSLKALDIPYSFYDESHTNYSGSRQALLQYELSAQVKRRDVQQMLDELTAWRIQLWIDDGYLPDVPTSRFKWEWIPQGIPWIDPLKEVQANIAAIGAGLYSRTRALKEMGLDFRDVANEIANENAYLESLSLPVGMAPANIQITEVANAN